ncbi:MAG: FAD:protein FMN transferase, partial [Bacteroidaceae bacterium]|nr:FAD:protein FMN transferase [Bacteroidaceae bacterium]
GNFQHDDGVIFGTVFHATYQCDSSLHWSIMQELTAVDRSLSMFNPASTIAHINSGESTATDSLFRAVFVMSEQISKATDGCFDITVAPLVNAWGFGFKHDALPTDTQVDSLRQFIGYQHIHLEADTIRKEDPRMVMDCSAVAKGFGTDQVAHLFRRLGIKNFMIEIGGEIVVGGCNDKGNPWNIGINNAHEENSDDLQSNQQHSGNSLQAVISLTDCAMATSGNYRNFYVTDDGQKLAHTISPHTGRPVQRSIVSSTVFAPSCAMADGFATAFMVMGLEKAQEVLNLHPELQAYFIYTDSADNHQVWYSESLKEKLQ